MTNRSFLILFLLLLNVIVTKAQWPQWYPTATAEKVLSLIESYDKGYLIAGTISNNNTNKGYGLLIKTDVNGNIIWKKLFGDESSLTRFHNVIQTSDGGIALSGSINSDTALFVKLNPCGEVEWSRVLLDRKNILTTDIIELVDSSLQTMATNWDIGNPYDSKSFFIKLNKNGNFIQMDSLPQNEFCQPNPLATEIIRTNDNNYMITSSTANIGGQSLWTKTNTEMDKIWDLCWPEFYLTVLGKTIQSLNGDYYTTAGSPTGSAFTNAPKIYKFDQNGIPIKVFDSLKLQVSGYVTAGAICMFNDTVLVAGFAFENFNTPYIYSSYLIVTDTSGKKIQEIPLTNSKNLPIELIKTYDDKVIALYQNEDNDIAMCKFEKYTNSYFYLYYSGNNPGAIVYDSLCNVSILRDTTVLSPLVIAGIHEYASKQKLKANIEIWPNPAFSIVNARLQQKSRKGDQLVLINSLGQIKMVIPTVDSVYLMDINVLGLTEGIYILQHIRQGLCLETGKFVVKK